MRLTATVLMVAVLSTGCARLGPLQSGAAVDADGAATPAMDLVGTWTGTAFGVPGSLYLISTPVELTIKPDGTWSWSKRGQEQAIGRMRFRGSRIVLDETKSTEVEQRIDLERRGDMLGGLSGAFIQGTVSAVELRKVGS